MLIPRSNDFVCVCVCVYLALRECFHPSQKGNTVISSKVYNKASMLLSKVRSLHATGLFKLP